MDIMTEIERRGDRSESVFTTNAFVSHTPLTFTPSGAAVDAPKKLKK